MVVRWTVGTKRKGECTDSMRGGITFVESKFSCATASTPTWSCFTITASSYLSTPMTHSGFLSPPHILRPTPQKNRVWGRQLALSVVTEQQSARREAEELGGEVGGGGPGKYSIQADGQPSFCLLAALRILAEPKNVRRKIRHLAISGERVSWEGDMAVYNWLQDECRVILRKLPTSAQEDEVLKQGRGAKDDGINGGSNLQPEAGTKMDALCSENVHLAICWRLGYKLLVSRAIWHCAEMAAQLQEERSGSQPQ